ncbi:large conductance mechanosensitive channel protein MscL [Candidatus Falkowbacteria bacterium]|nr:large conductance mechanosensitive channel protein MscL [Candidatus Falkowbacteria bacterium]
MREFRDFIARGNVVDMAVGIIIGAAFTGIVTSLVTDLINPIIGVVTGGIDFSNLFINLSDTDFASLAAARTAGAPVFAYGAFVTAVINFMIIAFVVFLLVKMVNRIKETAIRKEAEAAAPKGPTEIEILMEIRDALKR